MTRAEFRTLFIRTREKSNAEIGSIASALPAGILLGTLAQPQERQDSDDDDDCADDVDDAVHEVVPGGG
jgi:hypothetical protein